MKYPRWFKKLEKKYCEYCGKQMFPKSWVSPKREYWESEKRFKVKKYCNNKCRSNELKEQKPEDNYFYGKSLTPWNKGKIKKGGWHVKQASGYVRVFSSKGKWKYEHRIVAEKNLGLTDDLCVHHKNDKKWDNRVENLEVLTTSEHRKRHGAKTK